MEIISNTLRTLKTRAHKDNNWMNKRLSNEQAKQTETNGRGEAARRQDQSENERARKKNMREIRKIIDATIKGKSVKV